MFKWLKPAGARTPPPGNASSAPPPPDTGAPDRSDLEDRIARLEGQLAEREARIQELEAEVAGSHSEFADFLQEVLIVFQEFERSLQDPRELFQFIEVTEGNMSEVIGAMDHILNAMSEMEDSEHQIGSIGNIIRDFATDTKVLSLNANIEAARAGDAGREFSIVAKEVYNISREIDQATENINHIVGSVRATTHDTSHRIAEISHLVIGLNESMSDFLERTQTMLQSLGEQNDSMGQRVRNLLAERTQTSEEVELF